MTLEVEAIYENGALKLARALPIREGEKVRILIQPSRGAATRLSGLIPWRGPREELERFLSEPEEGALGEP